MAPRTPEDIPPQKEGRPVNMNNFYSNLPDGSYRKRAGSEERARVIEAIDKLLASEFSYLDVKRIRATIIEAESAFAEAFNHRPPYSQEEFKRATQIAGDASRKAREELRPLFDKLIEMGFDPELLAK